MHSLIFATQNGDQFQVGLLLDEVRPLPGWHWHWRAPACQQVALCLFAASLHHPTLSQLKQLRKHSCRLVILSIIPDR